MLVVPVSADTSQCFYLNNVKRNIAKSRNMYVRHNFQLFQCLRTLFKDSYIDYAFKDESIIK